MAAIALVLATGTAASASAGPYTSTSCESWTRLKIRCGTFVYGAWAPYTITWYVDGVRHSTSPPLYGNGFTTYLTFACSTSRQNVLTAVVDDSLGRSAESSASARCLTGTP